MASNKESSKSHQNIWVKEVFWGIMEELWGQACWNQRPESWNYFLQDVCIILRKISVVSSSAAWKRTTANAACSCCPPTGRPMSLSIWWFDVGWKIRTPHNKQRGLEQRDWNREREGRKGRTIDRWALVIKDGGSLHCRLRRTILDP